jgi:hypothetical protein
MANNKNAYILTNYDDENDIVEWYENNDKKFFNCGCCDNCLCDDNIKCVNCNCNCNGDEFDDEYDYEDTDTDTDDTNFNINIIKNDINKKLVRITLQLNVIIDNKINEVINVVLDIKSKTYMRIKRELFS